MGHGKQFFPGEGGTPYCGLYREAPPERGAFIKLAVYLRVGKIAILVYERVTKSAPKWKKWWLKRSTSKGATFWQKWIRNWIRTTENRGKRGDYRKLRCFGLTLRYKKWENKTKQPLIYLFSEFVNLYNYFTEKLFNLISKFLLLILKMHVLDGEKVNTKILRNILLRIFIYLFILKEINMIYDLPSW